MQEGLTICPAADWYGWCAGRGRMTEEEEEGERSRRRTEEDRRSRRTEGEGGGKPASGGSFPLGLWRPPGLMSCALSLMSTLCDGYHLKLNNF